MRKDCSTCEFNFEGICAGSGNVYRYGEPITDDTKCCDDWGASFEYFEHQTTTAPRFLRDAYNGGHISYQDFSRLVDDYNEGRPVSINIFDAIKCVYGISMVDIAVVLGVSFGVVYSAKTKGFPKKRIAQFASGLCVPEKLLLNTSTNDFDELKRCKELFFAKPNIDVSLASMPDWKMQLAREISATCVHCPIHTAKILARVDHLYWDKGASLDEYTQSERAFILYAAKGTKKYQPAHHLEYFLDIACQPHMRSRQILMSHS